MSQDSPHIQKLCQTCGIKLPAIQSAWQRSLGATQDLVQVCDDVPLPSEVSLVAFGSLARKEFTSGSDLDWALLIDGRADSSHRELQLAIKFRLKEAKQFKDPNPVGAFGGMIFSHDLLHLVGGKNDTNDNLTWRLLMLLESVAPCEASPIGPRTRVLRGILQRYFEEETQFPDKTFFPRFFLNDVIRFWRTMAVDYVAKNKERGAEKWALRNLKLRFSRKLLYIAGLLLVYETTLFARSDLVPKGSQLSLFSDESSPELSNTKRCFYALQLTPLELLARACVTLELPAELVRRVFAGYDTFLAKLDSEEIRDELAKLNFHEAQKNPLFKEMRDLSHDFQEALDSIFLARDNRLSELTLKYAIF